MAGLVPAIHVFPSLIYLSGVDARHKAGMTVCWRQVGITAPP
jgi:hypothetical protein